MKSQAICQLLAFTQLQKDGVKPERDIIYLATCDEEVGGQHGVEYMLKNMDELRNASFVLSEGGCIVDENGRLHAQVSVAEKKLSQFTITAKGTGGHGSMPHKDNANEKVLRAAHAIISHQWPFRQTSIVSTYLNGVLKNERGKGFVFKDLKQALNNSHFGSFVSDNPVYNALLRNTVTPTILKGGEKVNVIPAESSISFDARLLPTESHRNFFKKIEKLAGKDVEVVPFDKDKGNPLPSGYNTQYFRGIKKVVNSLMGQDSCSAISHDRRNRSSLFQKPWYTCLWFFPYNSFQRRTFSECTGKTNGYQLLSLNKALSVLRNSEIPRNSEIANSI